MVNQRLVNFFYNRRKGWVDGTMAFIDTVRKYCNPDSLVLDLGAGSAEGRPGFYSIKGLVKASIGVDIDKGLYRNKIVDKKVFADASRLPFQEESFDLVYTDYVLEHIMHPEELVSEAKRVLKKNGFFIFRTPNLYYYVPLIAKIIPRPCKSLLIDFLKKHKYIHEAFPTFYRMNTVKKIKKLFLESGFYQQSIELIEKEPSYLMFNILPFLIGVLYERLVNSTQSLAFLRSNIIGVFRKL